MLPCNRLESHLYHASSIGRLCLSTPRQYSYDAMTDNLSNTTLGQYRLIEPVRQGGMATVYKAYQPALDRFVAVKVLLQQHDPQLIARFRAEARAIALLQNPHILPIYDYGEQNGLFYLVLQYVEGGASLADLVGAPLAPARAIGFITRLLAALDYAHARGVVHRDIKPANVLLPTPDWPMLADFGISKLLGDFNAQLTATGMIIGTAAYMAPEQALGKPIDHRTDLYSVGVVLYELLTGRIPFEAESPTALLIQHAYAAPLPPRQLNPELPAEIDAVLLRVLAKNPDDRYQSTRAFAAALERIAAQIGPEADDTSIARLYDAGARAFEAGYWDQAIAYLGQVVSLAPEHADGARLLSAARTAQERAKDAARQQLAHSSFSNPATNAQESAVLSDRPTTAQLPVENQARPASNQGPTLAELSDRPTTAQLQLESRARPASHQQAALPAEQPAPSERRPQRWPMILAALVALLALGGIAAFIALQTGRGATSPAGTTNPSTAASPPTATPAQAGVATTARPSAGALAGGNGAQANGTLLWNDLALHDDSVKVSVSGLPAPNTGEVYAAWLASDTNSLALGPLGPSDNGSWSLTYTSPIHENLLGRFDRVYITKVPDIAATTEVANVIMAGTLPAAELAHIRHGLFSYESTPNTVGFAIGMLQELIEVQQHTELLKTEAEAGRLNGEKLHTEHIVNIIEGQHGQHFGDLNHDGKIQNPGDGFGLLENGTQQGYIASMVEHSVLAATAPDALPTAKRQADGIRADGDVLHQRVTQIRDLALAIDQANTAADTRDNVLKLVDLANQTLNGDNAALIMYQQLQAMALIAIAPVDPNVVITAPVPAPPPKRDGLATNIVAGGNTFTPSKITVVRGTMVVWTNQGGAAHTVTADDATYDSKTLAPNASFSHTFTEPGVYPYYCQIHGGAHGEGMSGAIIVTDTAGATP